MTDEGAIQLRYSGHAQSVRLATWMPRFHHPRDFQMVDGVWRLDLRLPKSVRVEYRLEIERDGRWESILDPANPVTASNPFGQNSVLTGEAYSPPEWLDQPVSRYGVLSELRVVSRLLGGRRSVRLYRPFGYVDRVALPLLFVFDGSDYKNHAGLLSCFDSLIEHRKVAPFRAVLSDPRQRHTEYTASELHARAMLEEVLPYVENRVHVAGIAAMGASLGAVAAWNSAHFDPTRFLGLILQSGTFARSPHPEFDDQMTSDIRDFTDRAISKPLDTRVPVHQSCGKYESLIDWNAEVAGALARGGRTFAYRETWTGHDWGAWRDQIGPGLEMVFPPAPIGSGSVA